MGSLPASRSLQGYKCFFPLRVRGPQKLIQLTKQVAIPIWIAVVKHGFVSVLSIVIPTD